jgi:hypothetical protein
VVIGQLLYFSAFGRVSWVGGCPGLLLSLSEFRSGFEVVGTLGGLLPRIFSSVDHSYIADKADIAFEHREISGNFALCNSAVTGNIPIHKTKNKGCITDLQPAHANTHARHWGPLSLFITFLYLFLVWVSVLSLSLSAYHPL